MGYITETKKEEIEVVVTTGAKCDECGGGIECSGDRQCTGALGLILFGGYGWLFDDQSVETLLCKPCAEKFLTAFPGIADQMEKQATW